MIGALIILTVLLGTGWHFWRKAQTRKTLLASPLTRSERRIIAAKVPITRRMPPSLRPGFEGRVRLFLHQVEFIGYDGLKVTEAMRLSIAAQACLLVVNNDQWYDSLRTILLYPGAFTSRQQRHEGFVVTERYDVRLGESWSRGPVVLSWEHSEYGAGNPNDGQNVVFHEFAHQLDNLSGRTDGMPILARGQNYEDWTHIFNTAFERHVRNVRHGRPTYIDAYGTMNPQEFFAVCVELFFENPRALRYEATALYRQFKTLFGLDPLTWRG